MAAIDGAVTGRRAVPSHTENTQLWAAHIMSSHRGDILVNKASMLSGN